MSLFTLWLTPRNSRVPSAADVAPAACAYFSGSCMVLALSIVAYLLFFYLPYVQHHSLPPGGCALPGSSHLLPLMRSIRHVCGGSCRCLPYWCTYMCGAGRCSAVQTRPRRARWEIRADSCLMLSEEPPLWASMGPRRLMNTALEVKGSGRGPVHSQLHEGIRVTASVGPHQVLPSERCDSVLP